MITSVRILQKRLDRAIAAAVAEEGAEKQRPLEPGEYEYRVLLASGHIEGRGVRVSVAR